MLVPFSHLHFIVVYEDVVGAIEMSRVEVHVVGFIGTEARDTVIPRVDNIEERVVICDPMWITQLPSPTSIVANGSKIRPILTMYRNSVISPIRDE